MPIDVFRNGPPLFIATIRELPGVVGTGDTANAAIADATAKANAAIAAAKAAGKTLPVIDLTPAVAPRVGAT